MDRRTFLETSTLIAGSGARGRAPRAARAEPPMVGIQVGAVSFVDEGTDKVLDGFQEMAAINTLFLATFTYGRGIAGRQLRGQPLPDHGEQEYDDNFRGGNFATPHPQYYRHTSIAPEKADGALRSCRRGRSEEHTSELQSLAYLVCRLLL